MHCRQLRPDEEQREQRQRRAALLPFPLLRTRHPTGGEDYFWAPLPEPVVEGSVPVPGPVEEPLVPLVEPDGSEVLGRGVVPMLPDVPGLVDEPEELSLGVVAEEPLVP